MIHHFNTSDTIDRETEIHYRFHTSISEADFPQVHDFYELSLTTAGSMLLKTDDELHIEETGSLVLIRPNVVHAKRNLGGCQFVNLAFPQSTMEALFAYLEQQEELQLLLALPKTPRVKLSPMETLRLHNQMQSLSTLPSEQYRYTRAAIRRLLLDCMDSWFIPLTHETPAVAGPPWLQDILRGLDNPANLSQGMIYMAKVGGVTTEHLCRTFQRYLGVSPGAYLNERRLNYAANLLRYSDHSLIDIAFEVGFQSESAFYHNFRRQYGVSPGRYRRAIR